MHLDLMFPSPSTLYSLLTPEPSGNQSAHFENTIRFYGLIKPLEAERGRQRERCRSRGGAKKG